MAERSGSEEVRTDKSSGSLSSRPASPENRPDTDKSLADGPICRFELVRGKGDAELARLAELQHGHLHLEQIRAAGIGRNALAHRVRTGRLHPALPCVYLVGRPHTDLYGRMMAAALYFRGHALVCGRAAAELWGLLDSTQRVRDHDPIDVILVGRNAARPSGVRVRRTASLSRQDIRRRKGIPVTAPALTVLGLAGETDDLELEAVLSVAFGNKLVRRPQLDDVIARNPYAKGVSRLRRLLADKPLSDTRSTYERKLLTLLRQAELPLPITNIWIDDMLVDGVWPDIKLVLEFDGWTYHGSRNKFESDRLRDQRLTSTGHRIMRVTRRQIDHSPYALIARIATTIANLDQAPDIPY